MVLTDPAYRRRGYARSLLDHTVAVLLERGIEWLQLDATDMGAPLYRRSGFADQAAVERWRGIAMPRKMPPLPPAEAGVALDLAVFGANRSALLAALAPLGSAAIPRAGYAMSRPGSQARYFGPCAAESAADASLLLDHLLDGHAGQTVYWDLLPDNEAAVELARARGFARVRRLIRMKRRGAQRGLPLVPDISRTFAIAGFEFG